MGKKMKNLCEHCGTECRFRGQTGFGVEVCPYHEETVKTVGDRFRFMKDEELAAVIAKAYSGGDLSFLWCDRKGGCAGEDEENLVCTDERELACVIRWLKSPAKEET